MVGYPESHPCYGMLLLLCMSQISAKTKTVRSVNQWRVIALARANAGQHLFRCAIVARAKFYMTS